MPFVKLQKNKAYFKRYQVKFARRRQGKTDYRARKRLVAVDKNKYNKTHRYRLVARLTGHYVIAQIVESEIHGDNVLAAAYSSELPRYGLKVGLKNYAAAYATGLLVARRLLTTLDMAKEYQGVLPKAVDGKVVTCEHENDAGKSRQFWVSAVEGDKKPFRAVLDVGVRATTTGARVFAVMKGASDGGLDIPHNEKRFPGYNAEKKTYDAAVHKKRIFGGHVADYLKSGNWEGETTRFTKFQKEGVKAEGMEAMYKKVHEAIRASPAAAAKKAFTGDAKFAKAKKLTYEARKEAVQQKKIEKLQARMAAVEEDDE